MCFILKWPEHTLLEVHSKVSSSWCWFFHLPVIVFKVNTVIPSHRLAGLCFDQWVFCSIYKSCIGFCLEIDCKLCLDWNRAAVWRDQITRVSDFCKQFAFMSNDRQATSFSKSSFLTEMFNSRTSRTDESLALTKSAKKPVYAHWAKSASLWITRVQFAWFCKYWVCVTCFNELHSN